MRVKASNCLHVHGDQRPDDLVHVAARAEVSAVRQEHHGLDVIGIDEIAESVAQFGIGIEGQRILALRPVELDDRHVAFHPPQEVRGLRALHRFHVSLSQSLRNDFSFADNVLGIARRNAAEQLVDPAFMRRRHCRRRRRGRAASGARTRCGGRHCAASARRNLRPPADRRSR